MACSLAAGLAACGPDPRQVRITEDNRESLLEDIKGMRGLTVEESGLLYAYLMRSSLSGVLGQQPEMVGKTVGELIDEQRRFNEQAEQEKQEHDRLAVEARAKEQALVEELRKAIGLSVYEKGFLASDARSGRYDDYITIKCAYENTSGKDIRAFTGRIRFTDLFDKQIFESGLTISDPIAAGQRGSWDGTIDYNQFVDEHQGLRNAELDDLKVVWLPSRVLFADGSSIGEE